MGELKPTNPKDGIGGTKVPLHLVSPLVKAYQSIAHFLGNVKYGAWNYLAGGARASVYRSALERHMDRWWSGEENDPVDGTPHLANALACINILIETQYRGNLIDDRPPKTDLTRAYKMIEDLMPKIRERYAHMDPRHWTIADSSIPAEPPASTVRTFAAVAEPGPLLSSISSDQRIQPLIKPLAEEELHDG